MSRISVQNVSKQFGSREIFKDLSFDIEENEFVALVGPSGSGKSTHPQYDWTIGYQLTVVKS